MQVELIPYQAQDIEHLVDFLIRHPWPFHSGRQSTREAILKSAEKGYYLSEHIQSFWIQAQGKKWGFIRLFDLEDPTPVFDIRLSADARGQGMGTQALMLLCEYVFAMPGKTRFEGFTRNDNWAMRKVFLKCGFLKEAHHRESWPDEKTGKVFDSIGYGLLKTEWDARTQLPFEWDDEPPVAPCW